jgi:hypothetical protein
LKGKLVIDERATVRTANTVRAKKTPFHDFNTRNIGSIPHMVIGTLKSCSS